MDYEPYDSSGELPLQRFLFPVVRVFEVISLLTLGFGLLFFYHNSHKKNLCMPLGTVIGGFGVCCSEGIRVFPNVMMVFSNLNSLSWPH